MKVSDKPVPMSSPVQRHAVTAEGLGRYDIDVCLPPSYHRTDTSLPVVYLLDGNLFFDPLRGIITSGTNQLPPSIVVGIGYPADEGFASCYARRNHDFHSDWDMNDPLGRLMHGIFEKVKKIEEKGPELEMVAGGAERFMKFLRDELHPFIVDRYRVDETARHTLIGDSSGGHFVLRAVFDPASPFRRYLCISPSVGTAPGSIEALEAAYADAHDDLDADLFLCAGDQEMLDEGVARCRIVSGTTWVREQLTIRGYPSARVRAEIMAGENHASIFPRAVQAGLRFVHGISGFDAEAAFDSLTQK